MLLHSSLGNRARLGLKKQKQKQKKTPTNCFSGFLRIHNIYLELYQDCFVFVCFILFLGRSLTLSPRLECNGAISANYKVRLPGSRHSPASASLEAGTTGVRHHAQIMFVFLVEMGFHHVGQNGLVLLTS